MTSELIGAELDAAVAAALGKPELANWRSASSIALQRGDVEAWFPSTNWAQGGPIIERERIGLRPNSQTWTAWVHTNGRGQHSYSVGTTALIAAMRAFLASKK